MIHFTKNTIVTTPLGDGVVQGKFIIHQRSDAVVGYIVRLPISAQTKSYMSAQNCLTPRARQSGLWVFAEEQLIIGK